MHPNTSFYNNKFADDDTRRCPLCGGTHAVKKTTRDRKTKHFNIITVFKMLCTEQGKQLVREYWTDKKIEEIFFERSDVETQAVHI